MLDYRTGIKGFLLKGFLLGLSRQGQMQVKKVAAYSPAGLHGRVDSVCGFHSTGVGSIPSRGTCLLTERDACEICV